MVELSGSLEFIRIHWIWFTRSDSLDSIWFWSVDDCNRHSSRVKASTQIIAIVNQELMQRTAHSNHISRRRVSAVCGFRGAGKSLVELGRAWKTVSLEPMESSHEGDQLVQEQQSFTMIHRLGFIIWIDAVDWSPRVASRPSMIRHLEGCTVSWRHESGKTVELASESKLGSQTW